MRVSDMNTYHINEGFFHFPTGYEDETTHALTWPPQNDTTSPFSLTLNRDRLQDQDTLKTYVAYQIQTLKQDLEHCQIFARRSRRIDGLAAEEIEFTWLSDGDKMAQRQAYVAHKGNVLVFTATMIEKFTPEGHQYWEDILSQFQFREGMK